MSSLSDKPESARETRGLGGRGAQARRCAAEERIAQERDAQAHSLAQAAGDREAMIQARRRQQADVELRRVLQARATADEAAAVAAEERRL